MFPTALGFLQHTEQAQGQWSLGTRWDLEANGCIILLFYSPDGASGDVNSVSKKASLKQPGESQVEEPSWRFPSIFSWVWGPRPGGSLDSPITLPVREHGPGKTEKFWDRISQTERGHLVCSPSPPVKSHSRECESWNDMATLMSRGFQVEPGGYSGGEPEARPPLVEPWTLNGACPRTPQDKAQMHLQVLTVTDFSDWWREAKIHLLSSTPTKILCKQRTGAFPLVLRNPDFSLMRHCLRCQPHLCSRYDNSLVPDKCFCLNTVSWQF